MKSFSLEARCIELEDGSELSMEENIPTLILENGDILLLNDKAFILEAA